MKQIIIHEVAGPLFTLDELERFVAGCRDAGMLGDASVHVRTRLQPGWYRKGATIRTITARPADDE